MARAYSLDLRERVVATVLQGGLSRREAATRLGVAVSSGIKRVDDRSAWEFVHAEERSYKTKMPIASERDHCDITRRRAQCFKYQDRIDPSRLVFIDGPQGPLLRWRGVSPENGAKTNMPPFRGWAPCGERFSVKAPHGHWQTSIAITALRHGRVEAPWLLVGPVNGEGFLLYVEPALRYRTRSRKRSRKGRCRRCYPASASSSRTSIRKRRAT